MGPCAGVFEGLVSNSSSFQIAFTRNCGIDCVNLRAFL